MTINLAPLSSKSCETPRLILRTGLLARTGFLLLLILSSGSAYADGINIPILVAVGFGFLVPIILFDILVEGLVLAPTLHVPFRQTWGLLLRANVVSLLAGIPTKVLNSWIYNKLLPQNLVEFSSIYGSVMALGILVYFIITVFTECSIASYWNNKQGWQIRSSKLFTGMLLANVLSYSILDPVHFHLTKPKHTIDEFTLGSSWAEKPTSKIVYIDSATDFLMAIDSDGSNREIVVPIALSDYIISSDLNVCVFRDPDNQLCHFSRETGQKTKILTPGTRFWMNQVAFSPSGEKVAFYHANTPQLSFFDVSTKTSSEHVHNFPEPPISLTWSTNEWRILLSGRNQTDEIEFKHGMPISVTTHTGAQRPEQFKIYGRGGAGMRSRVHDEKGTRRLLALPGLGSHVRVLEMGTILMTVTDSRGLLGIAGRQFKEVSFLRSERECIFGDEQWIYLLDVDSRKLGSIAAGNSFIVLNERYLK